MLHRHTKKSGLHIMSGEFKRKMHMGKQLIAASKEPKLAVAVQWCHDHDLSVCLGVLD